MKIRVAKRGALTERVVDTKVETTVDDDTNDGRDETTVETSNTIAREGLSVDVNQAVELTSSSALGRLGIVGKTGTGVVEGVDEEQRRCTGTATRREIASEPLPVALALLETEQCLEVILCSDVRHHTTTQQRKKKRTEGKVEGLGREVTDDVGGVSSPQRNETLFPVRAAEGISDALVGGGQAPLLDLLMTCQRL
jgi:hypothetical protein